MLFYIFFFSVWCSTPNYKLTILVFDNYISLIALKADIIAVVRSFFVISHRVLFSKLCKICYETYFWKTIMINTAIVPWWYSRRTPRTRLDKFTIEGIHMLFVMPLMDQTGNQKLRCSNIMLRVQSKEYQ